MNTYTARRKKNDLLAVGGFVCLGSGGACSLFMLELTELFLL